jgi:hypothetical protein
MTLKALEDLGRELQIPMTKNHNRTKRARLILDKYNELDLTDSAHDPPLPNGPLPLADPKPQFERLIDGDADAAARVDQESPWGGLRPGAGRPEGVTDEVARLNRLSKVPNPIVQQLIARAFDAWAKGTGCDEVRLTKEEAVSMGLAWTNALEWTGVMDRLPARWMPILICGWTTANLVIEKSGCARAAAKQRAAQQKAVAENLN